VSGKLYPPPSSRTPGTLAIRSQPNQHGSRPVNLSGGGDHGAERDLERGLLAASREKPADEPGDEAQA